MVDLSTIPDNQLDSMIAAQSSAVSAAILGQESNNNPNSPTSVDGAVGSAQIEPATFKQYALPGEDINNPIDNIAVHKRIIEDLSNKAGGDPARIAVGYFSGPGNIAPLDSNTPYIRDHHDGNGKKVSSYVSDVLNRMNPVSSAMAEDDMKSTDKDKPNDLSDLSDEDLNAQISALREKPSAVSSFIQPIANIPKYIGEDYTAGAKNISQPFPNPTGSIGRDLLAGQKDAWTRGMGVAQAIGSLATGPVRALAGEPFSNAAQAAGMLPQTAKNWVENPVDIAGSILVPIGAAKYAPEIKAAGMGLIDRIKNSALLADESSSTGPVAGAIGKSDFPKTIKSGVNARDFDTISKTTDALGKNTTAAYDKAKSLGATLTPEASINSAEKVTSDVTDAIDSDLDPALHPQTKAALGLFAKKAENGLDLNSLENTRKQLGRIAYSNTTSPEDAFAAKQAIKSIDNITNSLADNPDMLVSGTPEAVAAIKEGRAASMLARRHSEIADMIRNAGNDPNKLQTAFNTLYKNQKKFNAYDDDEQEIIKKLAQPGFGNKVLKTIGKAGFGGSGHILPLVETGSMLYNPVAGVPIAAGTAANFARKYLSSGEAENLLQKIASKSVPVKPITPSPKKAIITPPKMLTYQPKTTDIVSDINARARQLSPEEQAALDARRLEDESLRLPEVRKAQSKNKKYYDWVEGNRAIDPNDPISSFEDATPPDEYAKGGVVKKRHSKLHADLKKSLGRAPKSGEIELAEYIGPHHVKRLLNQKSEDMPAHKMFPKEIVARHRKLFFSGKRPHTVAHIRSAL